MDEELNVLLIHADDVEARKIIDLVQDSDPRLPINIWHTRNPDTAVEIIAKTPPDIILLDFKKCGFCVNLFIRLNRDYPGIAIVVMGGEEEKEQILLAQEMGAQDYINSWNLDSKSFGIAIECASRKHKALADYLDFSALGVKLQKTFSVLEETSSKLKRIAV